MKRPASALWLFVAYGAFVIYGSLVPLDFQPVSLAQAWASFQNIPFLKLGLASRADWVANGVLYAPLAFFAARAAFGAGLAQPVAVALSVLGCCALAVGVEFTQLFFPPRTVSQNDILAECIGSVVGACAAPFAAGWLDRLSQGWRLGGMRLAPRLLELYTASYVLLCFFPYDLLLSADELQGKLQGQGWGWWLAPLDRGLFFAALQLAVEVVLAMPVGALWCLHRQRAGAQPSRVRLLPAATVGLLLGLLIETGQFFVDSGVSQGASVLSRGVGVLVGAALLPRLQAAGWSGLQAFLRPWVPLLVLAYLPLLIAVNGMFKHGWHGLAGAAASWQGTRLLPFYYHYYTTEALALFSLGSIGLMYLPVAVLAWARGGSLRWAVGLSAALATAVEAGKLFVDGLHADPTNIIVAAATNGLALGLLALAQQPAATPAVAVSSTARRQPVGGVWLLALPVAAVSALLFPAFPAALLALLLTALLLVWRWPVLALAALPAAMPVLDWAPWSGRLYWDEFDLLQLVCIAVAFHRTPRMARPRAWDGLTVAFGLLGVSLALSSLRALWPLSWPDDNSFAGYYSPYNALRIVKGAAWAWLFICLWQRLAAQGARRWQMFSVGIACGLALTVAFVLWERIVFAGLWDFSTDFRVTGPFSAMHKGGAYIECFLAVGAAFAVAGVLRPGRWAVRVAALLLLTGASYAMMVTYSRNGYAALVAVLLLSLLWWLAGLRHAARQWPAWAAAGAVLAVVAGIAVPVAGGVYARQRLAKSGQDMAVRQAHWADGLALRDDSLATMWIGVGVGRFPDAHFWRSREAAHAASYSLGRDGDTHTLRLAQGAPLYIEQILMRPKQAALQLTLELRAVSGQPALAVALCEKWTLTSRKCVNSTSTPATSTWQQVQMPLDASSLLTGAAPWRAPLKLALLTPQAGALEVAHVRLTTAQGESLLANGDFSHGMDHWLFATDIDPPWHLHSLPVAVLFDQGWLGVVAWTAVVLGALGRGALLLWRGQTRHAAAWVAAVGFCVSGSLNTLIDAPRFLWLLLVLLWLAAARSQPPPGLVPGPTSRPQPAP